jgi:hypothetical protein
MDGYTQVRDLPSDVVEQFDAFDAARQAPTEASKAVRTRMPPGFDDDSHNEQEGGAFIAWVQNKGHGSFDLMAARDGDDESRIIASGGWGLENFQLDPSGTHLFYNGEDGLVVTDPDSRMTRRLKSTHGTSSETRPINMSADGEILVYSTNGSCTRDAADEAAPDTGDDSTRRVCLAYLKPPDGVQTPEHATATLRAKANTASADPWMGQWKSGGDGSLSATIRHGAAKSDYLVIDLHAGIKGCTGAVTLYGKPKHNVVLGESYDSNNRSAPVCCVELSLDKGVLKAKVAGPCDYYHGGSCGFDGHMTRSE